MNARLSPQFGIEPQPLHPACIQAAEAISRPSLNDDDIYVIDLHTRKIVDQLGSSSIMAMAIRSGTLWGVKPGQALVRGMQARLLLVVV